MTATPATELEPGVFLIDHHFQRQPGVIASYLLADADELTLIETGPTSTTETLLAGVRAAGHDPQRITRLLVTHIHLDHAGAAGTLLRMLPRARLFVHPVGAPHLVDPSRLLASATRIYGALMQPLWGEVLPVPEERVVTLADGAALDLGGRRLLALDTPGHAYHHLAFHDPERGAVYTGDVCGVRVGDVRYVRPPTPPPELDLVRWRDSIARLRALGARRLYLTHFGGYDDVDWHLDDLLARLFAWGGWVEAHLEDGDDPGMIAGKLRPKGDAELAEAAGTQALAEPYEMATNYRMTVDGYARWFRTRGGRGAG